MPDFISQKVADNLGLSLAILLGLLACRWTAEFWTTRGKDAIAARQRRFTIRAVTNALIAVCLLGVWLAEIQNLVFSLAAVMVALVIATKELLMCVGGAMLRLGGHLFKVGDRIELNGLHGEVIDHGLFSTTIMEIPPVSLGHAGTGRRLTLPNSLFLACPVRVEPQPRQFAPHRFTVTLERPVPAAHALNRLEASAEAALAEDTERAARFHRLAVAKTGVDIAGPGYEVTLGTSDLGKLQFHVMLYCLTQDARALEQTIIIGFLTDLENLAMPDAETARTKLSESWDALARKLRDPRSNAA
ncbi:mechanosensitive ion channel protein MscS [Aureimonas sp. SA4125]|uniref:mechanosensitive ion channel family protein n=1 Tax=Aureimonas sp. SA4125 TaxID=2826993 RepID=UPI001CC7FA89|nr:mechanosensitive ion channel family protein [Aureimonas sp. SA4125]BDA86750.1 mechanosensitive ion channel protein MscS [Aureimonas sp. SA4125]